MAKTKGIMVTDPRRAVAMHSWPCFFPELCNDGTAVGQLAQFPSLDRFAGCRSSCRSHGPQCEPPRPCDTGNLAVVRCQLASLSANRRIVALERRRAALCVDVWLGLHR